MKHIRSIDGLRGVAVLGVLIFHLSGNSMLLGSRGVDLFFVISGFCLGLGALERGFDRRAFAWARAKRIIPPYYAAILLGIVVAVSDGRLTLHHALLEGLRNAVFFSEHGELPTINGPFWTILLEARWYVYFPFVLWLYTRSKWAFAGVLGACVWRNYYSMPWMDRETLPTFMLGIVAADLTHRNVKLPGISWAAFIVLAALALRPLTHTLTDHGDFLWSLAFFLVILAGIRFWAVPLTVPPLAFLGRISYSLYLAQASALELLIPWHISPWLAGPVIIVYSYLFYLLFERRKFSEPFEKLFIERISRYAAHRCRKESPTTL